jgi:hypothetical protein
MSWIKDNKFVVALGGGTLAGAVALFLLGSKGGGRYTQAKEDFEKAKAEVAKFTSGPLKPTQPNVDGKTKALNEYRKATEALQEDFDKFRPKELKNVSPQEFTTQLKAVDQEVRKACGEKTKLPDAFFCGFENYKSSLARGNTTGVLGYQLDGMRNLMLALAKSGATELKNLHRPLLAEEEGGEYKPAESAAARPLPLEMTFVGPEEAVREFFSAIIKMDDQYFVIRTVRLTNSKKDPPRTSDAQFEKPAAVKAGPAAGDIFGGGFVLPGDEPKPDDKPKPGDKPKVEDKPKAEDKPKPADSSRILAQVLGNEEVQVFLRLDLMQFLPAKKLP